MNKQWKNSVVSEFLRRTVPMPQWSEAYQRNNLSVILHHVLDTTPFVDLLDELKQRQWRLDLNRKLGYRCMYWCAECHLWRCVCEDGAYHEDPADAIRAALKSSEQ